MQKVVKKLYLPPSPALYVGAVEGGGEWALVQSGYFSNGGTSSDTIQVTLSNPVGSGNLVCIAVASAGQKDDITITDDKGNTYAARANVATSGDFRFATFSKLNLTNGPVTFTATFSDSRQYASILVDEFSGAETTASLDKNAMQAQAGMGTGANAVTSGSQTTTADGELIWGATVDVDSFGVSAGSGFTQAQYRDSTYMTEYRVQTTAGSVAATFTAANSSSYFITGMLCFKKV